jgi:hypothetical protein
MRQHALRPGQMREQLLQQFGLAMAALVQPVQHLGWHSAGTGDGRRTITGLSRYMSR